MANRAKHTHGRIAVIDIGSNTVLLLVLEKHGVIAGEASRITRLGQGVFASGWLAPEAIRRTRAAVDELCATARELGASPIIAVGTEALRRAADGEAFLASLSGPDRALLLSGEQEAGFTIEAARRARSEGNSPLLVIDVGGGSTELAWSADGPAVHGISLPLGSVRLTEAMLPGHPVPAQDMERLRRAVEQGFAPVPALPPAAQVVAVAGTATTLAALELELADYDRERIEGYRITRELLSRWLSRLSQMSVTERQSLPGMEPGRADVIVAGLMILDVILGKLDAPGFDVSGRGVRHGVALHLLEGDRGF